MTPKPLSPYTCSVQQKPFDLKRELRSSVVFEFVRDLNSIFNSAVKIVLMLASLNYIYKKFTESAQNISNGIAGCKPVNVLLYTERSNEIHSSQQSYKNE